MDKNTTSVTEIIELIKLTNQTSNFDIYGLILATFALIISLFALYFSHFFKSSKAILCLSKKEIYDRDRKLYYTLSNLGNQELFIQDIFITHNHTTRNIINYKYPDVFIIKPGEVKNFMLHEESELSKGSKGISQIVKVNIIDSLGKRYIIKHDITNLTKDTKLNDTIYNCTALINFVSKYKSKNSEFIFD